MEQKTLTVSALTLVQLSSSPSVVAPPDEPGNQANERITITNDDAVLAARIRYLDADVPFDPPAEGAPMASVTGGHVDQQGWDSEWMAPHCGPAS